MTNMSGWIVTNYYLNLGNKNMVHMKKILIALVFITFNLPIESIGQDVMDENFAAAIKKICPLCLDKSNHFTSKADTLKKLELKYGYNTAIKSIKGIEKLRNLTHFECSGTSVTQIPILPANLKTFFLVQSELDSIFPLPNTLQTLYIGESLKRIPKLPNSLQKLTIESYLHRVISIPHLPTLPKSLRTLMLNRIRELILPTLPDTLETLSCIDIDIYSLPTLPASLQTLICNHTRISELPVLPKGLQKLDIYENNISILSPLPTSLVFFRCGLNKITYLPTLPISLQVLDCRHSFLGKLPTLPDSLKELNCSDNNLTVLPLLPKSLEILLCNTNSITLLTGLPKNLKQLFFQYNLENCTISDFPNSLVYLNCESNTKLSCLPTLGDNLEIVSLKNTNIRCIPNIPLKIKTHIDYATPNEYALNLPICTDTKNCAVVTMLRETPTLHLSITPNPVKDILTIDLADTSQNISIEVWNTIGQFVKSENFTAMKPTIDMGDLPNGIYILVVKMGSIQKTVQFLKW
jgi:Secretion system C-terminal sorting domain